MSNYPPGVSGFEPQIAGYPEREETREVGPCGQGDGEVDCPFEGGAVAGTFVGDEHGGTFYWGCPMCGNEIDTDVEPFEPDPDALRDAMLDAD